MRIRVIASNGAGLTSTTGAQVHASTFPGDEFEVTDALGVPAELVDGTRRAFKHLTSGCWLTADIGKDPIVVPVVTDRTWAVPREWELWNVTYAAATWMFESKTSHGFMTAEIGTAGVPVTANRPIAGPWESFSIVAVSPGPTPLPPSHQIRTDFLTARGATGALLPSGEHAAQSAAMQTQIETAFLAKNYTHVMQETNYRSPDFDWLKSPEKFYASIRRLGSKGLRTIVLFGAEAFKGSLPPGYGSIGVYAKACGNFILTCPADVLALIDVTMLGLECDEWVDAAGQRTLGLAVQSALRTRNADKRVPIYIHQNTQQLAPFGVDIVPWWRKEIWCRGIAYQFGKTKVSGGFKVDPISMRHQCFNVRELLATVGRPIDLVAGEYAYGVTEAEAQRMGSAAISTGLVVGVMNGCGLLSPATLPRPEVPAVDAVSMTLCDFYNVHKQNVSSTVRAFPIQVTLTVDYQHQIMKQPLDPIASWPLYNDCEGNYWMGYAKGGRWHVETWDYFGKGPDGYNKGLWEGFGLPGWQGKPGERILFMASRLARDGFDNGSGRSQLVSFKIP